MAGDTILTRSRDDAADAPIYIDDALPGDILVVHLLRIAPVGNLAHGGRELMYQWFLTSFARSAGITPRIGDAWALDTASQVAKLSEPTEHLRGFEIPMHPMLGAIGVAPRTPQHWSEEGEWGGNLDYNRIVAGTTLYIPVFNRGAYLYIGSDAHAAQGDGELASQGLEMEADVDFVVDVIPGGASRMKYQLVRAEDGTHIMAFGSAGDLRVAMQRATTNLATWLQSEYHLNQAELAVVLGSSLQIDVANVYGNQLTVVARLAKSITGQLKH